MSLIGLGFKLEIDDGAANAYQVVNNLVHVKPASEGEVGKAESKRLNLVNGVITYVPTLTDPGEFEFVYEYALADKNRLDGLKGVSHNFRFTWTEASSPRVKSVPGFIMSNDQDEVEADKILTCTCKVCVTGPAS